MKRFITALIVTAALACASCGKDYSIGRILVTSSYQATVLIKLTTKGREEATIANEEISGSLVRLQDALEKTGEGRSEAVSKELATLVTLLGGNERIQKFVTLLQTYLGNSQALDRFSWTAGTGQSIESIRDGLAETIAGFGNKGKSGGPQVDVQALLDKHLAELEASLAKVKQ